MFTFRLEAVYKIRLNREEQAQLALGREQTILHNHKVTLEGHGEERQAMLTALDKKKTTSMSGAMVQLYMESIRAKEFQSKILATTIASQQHVVDQKRHQLAEAVKNRKIIDTIRKRDLLKYQQEELKKEQDESDEMAVLRFKNKK